MPAFNYSERPLNVELGAAQRVLKRGVAGAAAGAGAGAAAGAFVLGIGALPAAWAGMMLGGIAGIASGMHSSDPAKIKNRPITIQDPIFEQPKTVYVSAEQWSELKKNLANGLSYDEFPPALAKQFDASQPPAP